MNRLFKGFCAVMVAVSVATVAPASSIISNNSRVLTPPVWMDDDMLLDNENIPVATDDIIKSEQEMGFCEPDQNGKQKFTNHVDGYSIVIPNNMKVDMSLSNICTTFSDNFRTLRIFKESFDTTGDRLSYLTYSNKFIENTSDHKLEKKESYTIGEYEYHILQWSRDKLARVSGDKNYYACVDVCIGARVYTFFFTASKPFVQCGGYVDIVNSLKTFDPSIPESNAYNKGYKGTDISRLNPAAAATYNYLFAEDASFKMGMFAPDQFGGFPKMEEFEETLGYKFCTFLVYTEVTDRNKLDAASYLRKVNEYILKVEHNFKYAQQTGKSIELTLQTPLKRDVDSNMIYEILDGNYDQFINAYARLIAKYPNVTVLFRPFNEMNSDWCNYSAYHTSRDPQIYVELYKYLYNKFTSVGCRNMIWVWNPNEIDFPRFKWNDQSLYYPGDKYVDVYGITGYNTGTYYEAETWRDFDDIYEPIYTEALRINEKPIMITEFSCSAVGGDKVAWVDNMFKTLPKYDKIKVGIWWHATDYDGEFLARPYFMDTPDGMLEVFDKYLN